MGIFDIFKGKKPATVPTPATTSKLIQPGEDQSGSTEIGQRSTPEQAMRRIMRMMYVDTTLVTSIREIRDMDKRDGRVKKIHMRTSRAAAKGGIKLNANGAPKWLTSAFADYQANLHLCRRDKLESDIRGLMMEGNLCTQWVLDKDQANVIGCVRMPAETIKPNVGPLGVFEDPTKAYEQWDMLAGRPIAQFGLWQMSVSRLTPDNYDDFGSLGRPYLDASRTVWKQLTMTEEDLVIRRRMRAPLRMVHVMEGAGEADLQSYRLGIEQDQAAGNYRDYYMNKKGSVASVQGDTNLDQIADVSYLLDNFFSGAPAPKALFGYTGDLSRDVLADLKVDYFDEIDALQDNASWLYEQGFRLHLLLKDRNPDAYDFSISFAERRTDTPNQRADQALKYQAMGVPQDVVWDTAGLDVNATRAAAEEQAKRVGPYPNDGTEPLQIPAETNIDPGPDGDAVQPFVAKPAKPNVAITPGNARGGGSATTISTTRAQQ